VTDAIQKLARALAEHDGFGAVPDDAPVMLDHDNCLYELVDPESLSSRLTLGDLRAILALVDGGPVSITHAKPGDDRETVVERFATIAAAEAFLNLSAGIDPDDLAAGHYGINAPHGAGSDNEAIAMARRLGLIGPQDTDAAAAHRALTTVEP
jgi:hypothetical protein